MLIYRRNALMAGKRLPYDAEVEYLESTGTQWIDTGITFSDSSHTYKWEITAQSVNESSGNYKWFCGYFTGYPHCCGTYNDTIETSRAFYPTGKYYANGVEISSPINATDKKYDVVENIYSVNGLGTSDTLTIFTRRDTRYGTVSVSGPLRVYACKLYDNANLVRDFIPVRVGTVGYLYDRVSGKLFGNAGTGDFTCGPDVVPVEYIESHGTEYIDTGIKSAPTTKAVVDTAFTSGSVLGVVIPSNYSMLFCFTSGTASTVRYYYGSTSNYDYTIDKTMRHVYGISKDFEIDGSVVYTSSNTLTTGMQNIYAFGRLNNGNPNDLLKGKIFSLKIYDGDTPARKFLPVRVGTGSTWEGAMMDVLTRKVYRNQGTGAFTYGNDLKYPIPAE